MKLSFLKSSYSWWSVSVSMMLMLIYRYFQDNCLSREQRSGKLIRLTVYLASARAAQLTRAYSSNAKNTKETQMLFQTSMACNNKTNNWSLITTFIICVYYYSILEFRKTIKKRLLGDFLYFTFSTAPSQTKC